MKKLLSLALGFALIGAAFQPLTEASRDAYHAYLMSQDTKRTSVGRLTRPTTEEKTERTKKYATTQMSARLYRNTRGNQQRYYVQATREDSERAKRPTRTFTTTTRAPWKQDRVVRTVRSSQLANVDYVTHRNDAFSLQLPVGYEEAANQVHTYLYDQNYEVVVKEFDASTCELAYGFTQCAITIAKNENYQAVEGSGRIGILDTIVRRTGKSDTVLNDLSVWTNTYTERFSAMFLDGEVYTLSRYFVRNQDGSIYLIETKVPEKLAAKYTGIDKTIFDSFRIYPDTLTE